MVQVFWNFGPCQATATTHGGPWAGVSISQEGGGREGVEGGVLFYMFNLCDLNFPKLIFPKMNFDLPWIIFNNLVDPKSRIMGSGDP